ncbi:MAG: EVE domain-containing protein [bacterium]
MSYWLLKADPDSNNWLKLLEDKKLGWPGVRNFQARNFLREMKKGDLAFYFHGGEERQVVGIARVESAAYPDPNDEKWETIDITPVKAVSRPVSIEEIRSRQACYQMPLLKQSRLSVQPVTESEWQEIMKISKTEL